MAAIRRVRLILIDLSGTLHVGQKPIAGCPKAILILEEWANRNHKSVRFLSNTTKESKAHLANHLKTMGFTSITPDRILTPLQAARTTLMNLGSSNPLCILSESAKSEINLSQQPHLPHDGVVVGLDPQSFNYTVLNHAFRLLKERAVPFVATHRGHYFKDEDDHLSMGPGPFVLALEESSGRKAITVGKPSRGFFEAAVKLAESELGDSIDPSEVIMVGDDVRDDVKGAQEMGFHGVLVRTGKFKPEDATGIALCVPSFVEFVDWVVADGSKSLQKSKL